MVLCLVPGTVIAQDNATDNETEVPIETGVRGITYNCFFYSFYDVFDSDITFSETIKLTFSRFSGSGIYIPVGLSFLGTYLAVDENLGQFNGDMIIFIAGTSLNPFIFGTGTIIMEYTWISPFFFHGLQSDI